MCPTYMLIQSEASNAWCSMAGHLGGWGPGALPSHSESSNAQWHIPQHKRCQVQATLLLGSVRPSRARAADWAAWLKYKSANVQPHDPLDSKCRLPSNH